MIKRIPITYEEFEDRFGKKVAKVGGIAHTPVEQIIVEKINEMLVNEEGKVIVSKLMTDLKWPTDSKP